MEQRENQRVLVSKRLLKEGLLRLLRVGDLETVNVSVLCRESGINRATFYRHYTCPRDVLVDLEMDIVRELERGQKVPTNPEEVIRYLENVCTYLYDHKELLRILIRCNTDEDLVGVLREVNQKIWDLRREVKGIENLDQDSLRLVSTFLYSGAYYLIRQWLTEDIGKTPQEVARLIYGIIKAGESPDL
ncbi:MAG: TetR family transcriptional regulator C-terminal domain-containing protein [Oscillospiraceae bacterium]|nr:TetR family transcriptional regulator C-terminal domain-containing protein [Oscillospiraceae bacterium]